MRHTTSTLIAAFFAAFSMTALAQNASGPPSPQPDKGNQDCYLIIPDQTFANPGKMFQWIGDRSGLNPPSWVDFLYVVFPGEVDIDNVGDFIDQRCEDSASNYK